MITYVIPCSGAKRLAASPAADLYTGAMFANTLAAAIASATADAADGNAARVLILSAEYGLITLDRVVAPYERKMGDGGSVSVETITAQAEALGIDWDTGDVFALLPWAYFVRLDAALRPLDVYVHNVYEVNAGIGDQRGINRCIVEHSA